MTKNKDNKKQYYSIVKIFAFSLIISVIGLCNFSTRCYSQTFASVPGTTGTTAIRNDSSIIVAWATGVSIVRGYMNIANPSVGFASFGLDAEAIGPAEGNSINVVSIGDSGVAVLTFDRGIKDEIGPDFAIFENGFTDNFIELAFVEVSSDGIHFFRFPSISEAPFIVQTGTFDFTDCRYFNNLAGKYRQGFGTPFDLNELASISGLDISNVTHVKIIDVIGTIDTIFGSLDSQGHLINDLYPTEFAAGGFDLDGVAVIHQAPLSISEQEMMVTIFPNPASESITVSIPNESLIRLFDMTGKVVYEEQVPQTSKIIDISKFEASVLFIEISNTKNRIVRKISILDN